MNRAYPVSSQFRNGCLFFVGKWDSIHVSGLMHARMASVVREIGHEVE